jgi:hypothetical protein
MNQLADTNDDAAKEAGAISAHDGSYRPLKDWHAPKLSKSAIQNTKQHIAVVSDGYADSS